MAMSDDKRPSKLENIVFHPFPQGAALMSERRPNSNSNYLRAAVSASGTVFRRFTKSLFNAWT
jgi:hypothetical protein